MRFAVSVLGTEVFAVEWCADEDHPSIEGGSGGQFELAADDYDAGDYGFRVA